MQFFTQLNTYIDHMRASRQRLATANLIKDLPDHVQKDIGWKAKETFQTPSNEQPRHQTCLTC